ncbi:DUF6285 domain-containing protein [Paraburkholderia saeva]|uniref:DUF6285 domain-containing protein n=1 Tax=Paraburkholderia saeva TaxID=2777537 RepID=UPI001D256312|nr:DUF6285 domain-containing protein [Paraburkholderia saeva]CAG4906835.1 hypothetical protein R70241_03461 [Paraburkholderia saeva]
MLNAPNAAQLLEAVSAFLRDEALPALSGAMAYKTRVAAGALDIVRRELAHAPSAQRDELQALHSLIGGEGGDLEALNRRLCERIADGSMDLSTPGVAPFLWQTTLAKLTIDQPDYDTYRNVISNKKQGT